MMLAAMLALVVVVAVVPALALDRDRFENRFGHGFFNDGGISQEVDQQSQSGDVSMNFSVSNTGDYANQCTPAVQFGNTGNFNNAPAFLQYASTADDFEPGGIEFTADPSLSVDCSSTIQQSAAASG